MKLEGVVVSHSGELCFSCLVIADGSKGVSEGFIRHIATGWRRGMFGAQMTR